MAPMSVCFGFLRVHCYISEEMFSLFITGQTGAFWLFVYLAFHILPSWPYFSFIFLFFKREEQFAKSVSSSGKRVCNADHMCCENNPTLSFHSRNPDFSPVNVSLIAP